MTETAAVMGVQELIDRIRVEGVESARQEGQRLVQEARAQADALLDQARREAQQLRDAAKEQIQADKDAGLEAVRLAARNTVMDLKNKVAAVFERQVRRLVVSSMEDRQFVRDLVLALAGKAAKEVVGDRPIEILLSAPDGAASGGSGRDRVRELVLGVASETLREGVTLVPDEPNRHGARVRVVGTDLEIDLSDEAITRLMLQHLLPRFWGILQGAD